MTIEDLKSQMEVETQKLVDAVTLQLDAESLVWWVSAVNSS